MIKPSCRKCRKELKVFGGIILSPPLGAELTSSTATIIKSHLCVECYKNTIEGVPMTSQMNRLTKHIQHCIIIQGTGGKHYNRHFPKSYPNSCNCWCHQ